VERAQVAALLPVSLTVLAALGWALGSLSSRLARPASPLRFALWMAVVPPLPLLALSAALEGPGASWQAVRTSWQRDALPALGALLFIVVLGTVVSSAMWSHLLARHPASTVAPFSMLVPVVGMAAAWAFLGEEPSPATLVGGALVLAGVVVGTLQWRRAGAADTPPAAPPAEPPATAGVGGSTRAAGRDRDAAGQAVAPRWTRRSTGT
jgi:drug/metabolite transporter (DMT)-like permease